MLTHKTEYFEVGDTWEIEGRLAYADGTPFNLNAGCAIEWAIEDSAGTTVRSATLGSGITVIDANGGVCLVTIQANQSAMIPVGNYTDQLRATDPGGYVSTQWTGPIVAKRSFFV